MSDSLRLNYITSGSRWARGWGHYEARTVRWLLIILLVSALLGLVVGIVLSLLLHFAGWVIVGAILASIILFVFLGVVFCKAIIPFVWSAMQTRDLEE